VVSSICDLPDVINCQFREFAASLGTRAFYVAGPTVWNSLPDHLQDPAVESEQFKRDLCSADVLSVSALEVFTYWRSTLTFL